MLRYHYFIHATGQPDAATAIHHVKVGQSAKELRNLSRIYNLLAPRGFIFYFQPYSSAADEFIYKLRNITGCRCGTTMNSQELLEYLENYKASAFPDS